MSQSLTPTKIYGPRAVPTKAGTKYVFDIYFKGVDGKCSYFSDTEQQNVFSEGQTTTGVELKPNGSYNGKDQFLVNLGGTKSTSSHKPQQRKSNKPADMTEQQLKDAIYRGKAYLQELQAELDSRTIDSAPPFEDDLPF